MKRLFCLILVIAFGLTACGTAEESKKDLTSFAEYEDWTLELLDGSVQMADNGKQVLRVTANYTNNSSEPLYAYACFNVAAFQNDVQLEEVSDINGSEASLIKEVKNGKSIQVAFAFELTDSSPVEVIVRTPTADTVSIGKKTYLDNETDKIKESIIYESDTLKATYLGVSETSGVVVMNVGLENKTNEEITVLPMDSSVDGTMVQFTSGIPATMKSGKNMNQGWIIGSLPQDNIEFTMSICDENMAEIEKTDVIKIEVK